ncbi:MAG: hypothetical protein A3F77_12995 [Betaproteobacteria bacterium RIFCSPLOWO2_12_FULL_67_28]|nr:MAG: hypothetical protein A3F77_12995 [Betaproteobacteria bacterium RIFCSPLOWO2_12_FULL_67_28]
MLRHLIASMCLGVLVTSAAAECNIDLLKEEIAANDRLQAQLLASGKPDKEALKDLLVQRLKTMNEVRKCADQGDIEAAYLAGVTFMEHGDRWALSALVAENLDNTPRSPWRENVRELYTTAIKYLESAANKNHFAAMEHLAKTYSADKPGIGREPDVALEWYARGIKLALNQRKRMDAVRLFSRMKELDKAHPLTRKAEKDLYSESSRGN